MLDKIKSLIGASAPIAPPPREPRLPVPVPMPSTAIVPVHRGNFEIDRPKMSMGYLERNPDSARPLIGFGPSLRTADEEVRRAWNPVAAQARHAMTTSGFLQYGVELSCAWTVGGDGLQPHIVPDFKALGWSEKYATDWARHVEDRYREWSDDALAADAQGRSKFGAMQAAALKSFFATGDVLATLDYGPKQGTTWKTSIQLLDPSRLWTPPIWQTNASIVKQGIEFDQRGRALAYHIKPLAGYGESIRIPRFTASGRQVAYHGFDAEAGTIRGISPLGAAIAAILQTQNVADAAVLAAHVAALIVGVVTSDLPTEAVARSLGGPEPTGMGGSVLASMMAQRVEWHEKLKEANAHLSLGNGGRIAHLSTGERFELLAGKQTFDAYEPILKMGLAEAARALGLAPEHLTGDKSDATYSSIRVAVAEAWSIIERRRKILIEPFCEWALTHVAEELIAIDELPFPVRGYSSKLDAFRASRNLALKAEWRGPAQPAPDELKAARAAAERVRNGLSSISAEIAATGADPDAVFKQRAADKEKLDSYGLDLPWPVAPTSRNTTGENA